MNIDTAFPGTYLKAADLQGRAVKVVIARVVMEDVGDDHKPVIYFQGKERGLVLNKTNANTIKYSHGPNTEQWVGKEIELFTALVDFQGRQVEAIRVRVANGAQQQNGDWQAPAPQRGATIAPNARDRAGAMRPEDDPLSDSVPF